MVLATKLKNTNLFTKIVAIILSVVLMAGACYEFYGVYHAAEFIGNGLTVLDNQTVKNLDFVETRKFSARFDDDIHQLSINAATKNSDKLRKELEKNREAFIDYCLSAQAEQIDEYENEDEIYDFEVSFVYEVRLGDVTYTITNSSFDDPELKINSTDSKEIVTQKANDIFDKYKALDYLTMDFESYSNDKFAGLKYYFYNRYSEAACTNLSKSESKDDLLKEAYSFKVVNGKEKFSKLLDKTNKEEMFFTSDLGLDAYVSIDFDNPDSYYYETNQLFKELKMQNYTTKLILGIAFALSSIALAIYSFIIAGKKDENGKVKPLFIDYVPFEIHLGAIALAIFLLIIFFVNVDDSICNPRYYKEIFYYVIGADCGAIWALFIELVTSVIRAFKSDRKKYKYSLIALIGYGVFKLVKKIYSLFTYKLESFKSRLISILIAYGVINLALLVAGFFLCIAEFMGLAFFDLFILVSLNVASAVFVALYVVDLDKIIVAAHNRTVPNVNYSKLPQSLKALCDSISYTQSELQSAVQKAVRDERMRTELITNVSHDLKTPLTSIINYVDLLKGCDIEDEAAKEYIAVLDERGSKLKRLIEDLIEASKLSNGVVTINAVSLNLSELSAQAVVEHQNEFVDNDLELVFKGDKQSVVALADGNKTFRVIENLLSNARKYSAKGSRVYVDVIDENNSAIFEIKNISAEPLDITPQELKERFVRGDKSRNADGNGLGLSIADNLCRAMNGRLELIIDGDLFKARVILPKTK